MGCAPSIHSADSPAPRRGGPEAEVAPQEAGLEPRGLEVSGWKEPGPQRSSRSGLGDVGSPRGLGSGLDTPGRSGLPCSETPASTPQLLKFHFVVPTASPLHPAAPRDARARGTPEQKPVGGSGRARLQGFGHFGGPVSLSCPPSSAFSAFEGSRWAPGLGVPARVLAPR